MRLAYVTPVIELIRHEPQPGLWCVATTDGIHTAPPENGDIVTGMTRAPGGRRTTEGRVCDRLWERAPNTVSLRSDSEWDGWFYLPISDMPHGQSRTDRVPADSLMLAGGTGPGPLNGQSAQSLRV